MAAAFHGQRNLLAPDHWGGGRGVGRRRRRRAIGGEPLPPFGIYRASLSRETGLDGRCWGQRRRPIRGDAAGDPGGPLPLKIACPKLLEAGPVETRCDLAGECQVLVEDIAQLGVTAAHATCCTGVIPRPVCWQN